MFLSGLPLHAEDMPLENKKKTYDFFFRDVYFNAQSRSKSRGLLSALLWVIGSLLMACVVVAFCEAFICHDASGNY